MTGESYFGPEDSTYCYPGTDILRNKLDIHDQAELSSAETSIVFMKMVDLRKNPVDGCFDSNHLREIHRRLFTDVYDWAGEFRTVEISKGIPFCYCANIQVTLDTLLSELKAEKFLRETTERKDMVARLAYYLVEINAIHPFREGNGRAQRCFLAQLADEADYELDFDSVRPDEMIFASSEGMAGNYKPMESVIMKCLQYRMVDVLEDSHGIKTSGAISWAGHVRSEIGKQIERQSTNVFNIPLMKINEPGGFKIPDYVNPERGVCIEVFSGTSKGRVVDIVSGIPMVTVRRNTAANHLIEALRHAKTKFNQEAESYIRSTYRIDGELKKIAMCSMDFTDYAQLDRDSILARLKDIHLSEYNVQAFVIYFVPAGLGDQYYGGDVFVFYENDIDKTLFVPKAEFIRLEDSGESNR